MKRFFTILSLILLPVCSFGQTDYEIAKNFMEKKGVSIENKSTTRTDKPYSIFNGENGAGFAIVKDGIVVGYSTNGKIDEIPAQLKSILETKTRYADVYPDEFVPRNLSPIEPLIRTKWGQHYPYNDKCPTINGERCMTGCAATAIAQLLYYYRLPYGCKEFDGKYSEPYYNETISYLPQTTFDWDNMLEVYENGNYTQEQVDAVAELMLYCGALSHCNYGLYETYGYINPGIQVNGEDIFSYYLSFDKSRWYENDEYSESEMISILDKELEAKRPVIVLGVTRNFASHFYLIDGRDSEGFYHINWGFSGGGDGYFIVSMELAQKYGAIDGIAEWSYYLSFLAVHGSLEYTSIDGVRKNLENGNVYSMQGMVVGDTLDGLPRGVYIQNGKKYIVK